MRATLGGITFEGGDGDSPFMIVEDGLKGWLSGVPLRREQVERPTSHGAFRAPGYRGGRVISIDGELYTAGRAKQEHYLARLSGLLADGGFGRLVVQDEVGSRWLDVSLNGAPTVTLDAMGLLARFQLELWAPDPRIFGEARTLPPGQSVRVFQYGTFPASPVVEVTGVMPAGYAVYGPDGSQYRVTQALAAGQTHRIDMRTGRLSRDGVLQLGAVFRAGTFRVPVGKAVTVDLVPFVGSGEMTVTVTDTY